MNQPHPYKLLHTYPGMGKKDEIIWDEYIKARPDVFDACYYNVPVGDPSHSESERDEMLYNGGMGVSQWRVDVLAYRDGKPFIIELKPNAGGGSIGQVLSYRAVLAKHGVVPKDTPCMVITNSASPIFQEAAALLGVGVYVV